MRLDTFHANEWICCVKVVSRLWPNRKALKSLLISTIDTNRECLYQYIKEQSSSNVLQNSLVWSRYSFETVIVAFFFLQRFIVLFVWVFFYIILLFSWFVFVDCVRSFWWRKWNRKMLHSFGRLEFCVKKNKSKKDNAMEV